MSAWLIVPADNPKKIKKCYDSGPYVLVLDLEDLVGVNKRNARAGALEFLKNRDPKSATKIYVRVNCLESGMTYNDLDSVMPGKPDGIMQPKTNGGESVAELGNLLEKFEQKNGIEVGKTEIAAIATETAASVLRMSTYAGCSKRLTAMSWGTDDLSMFLGASSARTELGHFDDVYILAKSMCLLGAYNAGVDAIDAVYKNFRAESELEEICQTAARAGWVGKLSYHENQTDIINRTFAPSPQDLKRASDIVVAFGKNKGIGLIEFDDLLLEKSHFVRAKNLLRRSLKMAALYENKGSSNVSSAKNHAEKASTTPVKKSKEPTHRANGSSNKKFVDESVHSLIQYDVSGSFQYDFSYKPPAPPKKPGKPMGIPKQHNNIGRF